MRNAYDCCDSEPIIGRIIYGEKFPFGAVSEEICTCCDGEPVVGRIIYGEKYPFGTVSEETYEADMEVIKGTVTAASVEINNLKSTVEVVSEIVINSKIDEAVAKNTADIAVLNGTAANLSGSVSTLSSKISAMDSALVNMRSDVLTIEENIRKLKEKDENLQRLINGIIESDGEQDSKISSLETNVARIKTDISSLSTRIDGLNESISSISSNLTGLRASINEQDTRFTNDISRIDGTISVMQQDYVIIRNQFISLTEQVSSKFGGIDATIEIIRKDAKETSESFAASIAVIERQMSTAEQEIAKFNSFFKLV